MTTVSRSEDHGRLVAVFPVMAAAYPAISIAAGNAFDTSVGEVALVGGALALLGFALHALIVAVLPSTTRPRARILISVLVVAWVFDAELAADRALWIGIRSRDSLILLTLLAIGATLWLLRTNRGLVRLTQATLTFVAIMPLLATGQFVVRRAAVVRAIERSEFLHRLIQPLPPHTSIASAKTRDVYILILDNYANQQVLAERYHFDNSAFVDSLRALGFKVPPDSRSNYGWTPLSLGSLLNGKHVTSLENDSVGRTASWDIMYTSIRRSRLLAAFARSGFGVYLIPSAYFPGTRTTDVGQTYLPRDSRSARARLGRLGLATGAWHSTMPGRLLEKLGWRLAPSSVALAPFVGMEELARRAGPKVVLAHSLITHPPYEFEADCTPRRLETGDERAYPDQVRCTNREVLSVLSEIHATRSAPIIVILADHGSASQGLPISEPAERIDSARARERFGAFRAVLFPAGMTLEDTTTPVNLMREIMHAELAIDLPMLPDSSYWSSFNPPFHYVAVDSFIRPRQDH